MIALALQPVTLERLASVLGNRLGKFSFVAPLRNTNRDRRTTLLGQPFLVHLLAGRQIRNQHLLRMTQRIVVEVQPLQDPSNEFGTVEFLGLIHDETTSAQHSTLTDEEDLYRSFEFIVVQTDDVEVLAASANHLVLLIGLPHTDQPIAVPGSKLELQLGAGLGHVCFEPGNDFVGIALEELDQFRGQVSVVRFADRINTRPRAFLNVEVEARFTQPCMTIELSLGARADGEGAEQKVERFPNGIRVAIGTEVPVALLLLPSDHHGPGPLIGKCDRQKRVALVVSVTHVVPRLVTLDERVFQHERFDFGGNLDPLDTLSLGDHLSGANLEISRVLEIIRQARPQVFGLADIDDPAVRILKLIRTRSRWDCAGRRTCHHPCRL